MKLLIPILNFDRTGGYRVLSELANGWIRAGHEVDFLTPATSGPPYFPTRAGVLRVDRTGPVAADAPRPSRRMTGLDNIACLWRGLRQIASGYDVVFANHSFTAWPVWLAGVSAGKVLYYVQAYEPEYYAMERRPAHWAISALSYRLPFRRVHNADVYTRIPGRPAGIVPFGIDLRIFRPGEAGRRAGAKAFTVGCIGRREPSKGTIHILHAFERLAAQDPSYRLRVAYGNLPDGWSHPNLEVVVPRNDAELADFYRSVDVLVAAGTVQHGAPHYPVLEAMACGTPVINTGYLPATAENAWLVPARDPVAIASAVARVRRGEEVAPKVGLGLEAVKPYAWDAIARQMLGLAAAK